MSTTFIVGLLGVSIQTSLVVGLNTASTFFRSVASTKVTSNPRGAMRPLKSLLVPPYTSSKLTMWSPGFSRCVTLCVAARPEAYTRAYLACSSEARHSSRQFLVGFPDREYSNP
uniref:Putative secreted protein n=1 Tax=Ixodes ricinus TaxID=34613 RepID=A0A6B0UKS3_IXORI